MADKVAQSDASGHDEQERYRTVDEAGPMLNGGRVLGGGGRRKISPEHPARRSRRGSDAHCTCFCFLFTVGKSTMGSS